VQCNFALLEHSNIYTKQVKLVKDSFDSIKDHIRSNPSASIGPSWQENQNEIVRSSTSNSSLSIAELGKLLPRLVTMN